MSKLIVVEGLDGAGKSTAISAIVEKLTQDNVPHVVLQEPGGTELGTYLRTYVKSLDTPQLDTKSELLLFFLSRSVLVEEKIKPLLAKGTIVILDRFYRTTVAYQGFAPYALNNDVSSLSLIRDLITGLELENLIDLEVYLDVPVHVSRERMGLRGTDCQIEERPDAFFEAARQGYLTDASHCDYIKTIDATQSKEQIASEITKLLE